MGSYVRSLTCSSKKSWPTCSKSTSRTLVGPLRTSVDIQQYSHTVCKHSHILSTDLMLCEHLCQRLYMHFNIKKSHLASMSSLFIKTPAHYSVIGRNAQTQTHTKQRHKPSQTETQPQPSSGRAMYCRATPFLQRRTINVQWRLRSWTVST